jgi:hypothetical protein
MTSGEEIKETKNGAREVQEAIVGGVLRGVFRISVDTMVRRPRWFPDGDAIPKQNKLGGTVIPGKGYSGPFMQFADEICN